MTTASGSGNLATPGADNGFFSRLTDILGNVSGTVGAGGEIISRVAPLWTRNRSDSSVPTGGAYNGNAGTIPTNSSANAVSAGPRNYTPFLIAGGVGVVILVVVMFALKGK